ncbi:MAG TPA: DUF6691 family protein [Flavisolibacter sp.]|jgi:uncharacterized membrane protein YedE/YeeE|nr:DUF6691 family protein [Flavisolibacter sp.]
MEKTSAAKTGNNVLLQSKEKASGKGNIFLSNLRFLLAGFLFGMILIKAEVLSWFRIQEMFRMQSFHMYGIIMSAIITGMISIFIIKRVNARSINKEPIIIKPKKFHKGYIFGGFIFGIGWAITGACPGPLFAQIGSGATIVIVTLLSALAGTWTYGLLRDKLPH